VDRPLPWRAVASAEAAEEDAKNRPPNAQDLLGIAREALLDIKFRRQSRIYFANALRTTRSTWQRWIGFSPGAP
jgi:hypothetical protein